MAVPPTSLPSPARAALRTAMRRQRAAFVASLSPDERDGLNAALAARLTPLLAGRQRISGYATMRDEIEPAGFSLWPRIVGDDLPLTFHSATADALIASSGWAPREPRADAPVAVPDAVLVPLLAADPRGYRLGYGKGHYDRTLAGLDALRIGVAWDCQIVARVPEAAWDEPLDWLVTPTRTIRCDPAGVGASAALG